MSSNHPITKRVQSKFQSLTGSSDCGCDSPSKKALVGNQKNLPDHIKSKILAAPETPAKQTSLASYGAKLAADYLGKKEPKKFMAVKKELPKKKVKPTGKEMVSQRLGVQDIKKLGAEELPRVPVSPGKQTKEPKYTDKLYEKSERLTGKAKEAASKGKIKKAVRLENRAARVDKREEKKRAKYGY